jgi:MFS family permease
LLPLLYQIGLGYAPWQAGLLTMPQALAAIGMKLLSKSILAKFGHRKILISNTLMLGLLIMVFSLVGPGTSPLLILGLSLAQGFVASIQFTSMNSLVYADVDDTDASKASSLSSTAQQLSLSVGVAFGSVVAAWFLGGVPTSDHPALISALHHAFIALGTLTILSAVSFTRLRPADGINVSNYRLPTTEAEATTTA